MEIKKIKISPEVLKKEIRSVTYNNDTFGVYSGMSQILSGGTGGSSLITDLSIPILLKQNFEDIGYYSPFDGELSQFKDDVNFIFTGDTGVNNGYTICVYNTSDYTKNYLTESTYTISWGDGIIETVTDFIPSSICHDYASLGESITYTISLTGQNQFVTLVVEKDVEIPYTIQTSDNPYGKVYFASNTGSWSNTPTNQDFIYPFDSNNTVDYQQSSNFVSVPFVITGNTKSRLEELQVYGPEPYILFPNIVTISEGITGYVESISAEYTKYVINDMTYFDYPNGSSIFIVQSFGLTQEMITSLALTKLEYLLNVIDQPQIKSYVFIERGKNSVMENFRRIGEVNGSGRLINYGYKFFDVRNYTDI